MDQRRPPATSTDRFHKVLLGCVIAITAILAGWTLRATAVVAIPLVFSVFLALLVAPVDRWGTRRAPGRARWLGHLAAMGVILLALVVFLGSIWVAAQQVLDRLPSDVDALEAAVPLAGGTAPDARATPRDAGPVETASGEDSGLMSGVPALFEAAGDSFAGRLAGWAAGYASTVLGTAGSILGGAVIVFFLTLLMLIEAPKWRDKMLSLATPSSDSAAMEAVDEIAAKLRRYLWTRTLLGITTGLLYAGWLWIFGLDLLFVWGLLALVLNFIPTLGSLVAGIAPVVYALLTRDLGTAALISAGLLAIEQVMGNYIDPRVQGRRISVSPLVVLIVLLFWGWIWGIAGAVLAVPITIALLIVAGHVPPLRPLALLLSDETDEAGLDRAVGRAR